MTLAATRDLLTDERVWCVAARVEVHDGETQHYAFASEGHLMISVRTLRHGVPIWALLKGGGSKGIGVWFIPPVGCEVIVNFDDGMFEGDAYIVGIHGIAPSTLAPGKLFLIGDDIQAKAENGTAKSVAFKDELQDLRDYVRNQFSASNGHVHVVSGGSTTTQTTVASAATNPTVSPPTPVGTAKFKAE